MEKETLEEAMERLSNVIGATGISDKHSFMLGTFWQREQDKNKYSVEEVLAMLSEVRKGSMVTSSINNRTYWDFDIKSEKKWFEQFKKK